MNETKKVCIIDGVENFEIDLFLSQVRCYSYTRESADTNRCSPWALGIFKGVLYEIHRSCSKMGCFMNSSGVIEDSSIMVFTKVDPHFLLLSVLEKQQQKSKNGSSNSSGGFFMTKEQLLSNFVDVGPKDSDVSSMLGTTVNDDENVIDLLKKILLLLDWSVFCELKILENDKDNNSDEGLLENNVVNFNEKTLYRLSDSKVYLWLKRRFDSIFEYLKMQPSYCEGLIGSTINNNSSNSSSDEKIFSSSFLVKGELLKNFLQLTAVQMLEMYVSEQWIHILSKELS